MKLKKISTFDLKEKNFPYEFFEDKICLENTTYEEIFGKKFSEQSYKPYKRGIVKVSFLQTNGSKEIIRALFYSGNSFGILKDEVGIFPPLLYSVTNFNCTIKVSKGSKFLFIWNHPNHMVRLGFRYAFVLGGLSVFLGLISLYTTIF